MTFYSDGPRKGLNVVRRRSWIVENRLAQESSPYLRQHAQNPVEWYPWGEEALALARSAHKPILLSVGYSACHWCHVMAHESFEDPATAALMNEGFVNIKVDREERPDLDQLYQGVVSLMGRGGGWPLTVFLTPDLRPFYGGTYFPPEERHGLPSFRQLLEALRDAYLHQGPEIEAQAEQFRRGLEHLATQGLTGASGELRRADIVEVGGALLRGFDPVHGGFGTAPKFPNPMNVAVLLRALRRGGPDALGKAALLTLEKMAFGGIYDQLAGGFHRYSTDARWEVPHFEKMLYDNAQLVHLYAEAHQVAPRPLWQRVVEETVAYVEREMTSPAGGFYATQDADSEGEEGRFFVWTPGQLRAALGEPAAALAAQHFQVTDEGTFEHGASVLQVRTEERPADMEAARRTLREVREQRIKPGRDEKILAGWNGLMIRGIALAARVFERPDWTLLAQRSADFVLETHWDGTRLQRVHQDGRTKIDGFLEDYGDLAAGLVGLYQASFEPRYLQAAAAIVEAAQARFWDAEQQAYLAAPRGQTDLLCATYALHDNAFPSGASTLTEAQVALAALTGRTDFLENARRYVAKLSGELKRNPFAFGHLLLAADALLDGAAEVQVRGTAEAVRPWLKAINESHEPTVCVRWECGTDRPQASLCHHFACQTPVHTWEDLHEQLRLLRT